MRLKIELPNTWSQHENPNGPATFCRSGSANSLQVSWAEYRGGNPLPQISSESLKQMAIDFGQKQNLGAPLDSSGGVCKFGSFGTATFRSEKFPLVQIWFLCNGQDHIMATYICDVAPEASELEETQEIAIGLALGS
jgi:hypothetical protein